LDPERKLNFNNEKEAGSEKVRLNKRLFTYLFFLFIAIIFWYLNALSKISEAQMHYTLFYNNFPKGKVLVSELPVKLNIQVRGYGFQILRYKIYSLFKPISIDLEDYQPDIKQRNNNLDYYLITRKMLDKLNTRFSSIQLIRIKPDTLFFSFTEVVDKKIAVKPKINIEFEKPYMLSGSIRVLPESLLISGPRAYIDTLSYIYTKEAILKEVKDTIVYTLELEPIKQFIYPVNKIRVFIPTERFTELSFNIPLEAQNVPEGYDLKLFPGTVSVSCMVSVSNYDKVSPLSFKAVVDYNSIFENKQSKLKVNLIKYPRVGSNIKIYPKSVEYILEK
jgi:hypothetical protein